jgi:hypothetical protein
VGSISRSTGSDFRSRCGTTPTGFGK